MVIEPAGNSLAFDRYYTKKGEEEEDEREEAEEEEEEEEEGEEGILTEQFVETSMAVRFVVLFLERALVQLLQAERAHKVLWMEFPEHRCYATACNWFVTTGTERPPFRVIMRLAVR